MADIDQLKATLAELGWTTSVSTPADLACEALRTLHTALERRKADADVSGAEIWKYKNALHDALTLAAYALDGLDTEGAIDEQTLAEKTAKLAELRKVLDE